MGLSTNKSENSIDIPTLSGKRILITGAATGIGREVTKLSAQAGARLCLADTNQQEGLYTLETVQPLNKDAFFVNTDVSDEEQVDNLFNKVQERFLGVDVVIHLSGILLGASVPLEEFPVEIWDKVISVNLRGSFLVARAAARLMSRGDGGVLVLTSSGAGVLGGSSSFAYGASKGGVHGLYLTMNRHLNSRIRLIELMPGQVATPLKIAQVKASHEIEVGEKSLSDKLAELADPYEIAKVFVWAVSDSADSVRGSIRTA